jgi:hypothetical protein
VVLTGRVGAENTSHEPSGLGINVTTRMKTYFICEKYCGPL